MSQDNKKLKTDPYLVPSNRVKEEISQWQGDSAQFSDGFNFLEMPFSETKEDLIQKETSEHQINSKELTSFGSGGLADLDFEKYMEADSAKNISTSPAKKDLLKDAPDENDMDWETQLSMDVSLEDVWNSKAVLPSEFEFISENINDEQKLHSADYNKTNIDPLDSKIEFPIKKTAQTTASVTNSFDSNRSLPPWEESFIGNISIESTSENIDTQEPTITSTQESKLATNTAQTDSTNYEEEPLALEISPPNSDLDTNTSSSEASPSLDINIINDFGFSHNTETEFEEDLSSFSLMTEKDLISNSLSTTSGVFQTDETTSAIEKNELDKKSDAQEKKETNETPLNSDSTKIVGSVGEGIPVFATNLSLDLLDEMPFHSVSSMFSQESLKEPLDTNNIATLNEQKQQLSTENIASIEEKINREIDKSVSIEEDITKREDLIENKPDNNIANLTATYEQKIDLSSELFGDKKEPSTLNDSTNIEQITESKTKSNIFQKKELISENDDTISNINNDSNLESLDSLSINFKATYISGIHDEDFSKHAKNLNIEDNVASFYDNTSNERNSFKERSNILLQNSDSHGETQAVFLPKQLEENDNNQDSIIKELSVPKSLEDFWAKDELSTMVAPLTSTFSEKTSSGISDNISSLNNEIENNKTEIKDWKTVSSINKNLAPPLNEEYKDNKNSNSANETSTKGTSDEDSFMMGPLSLADEVLSLSNIQKPLIKSETNQTKEATANKSGSQHAQNKNELKQSTNKDIASQKTTTEDNASGKIEPSSLPAFTFFEKIKKLFNRKPKKLQRTSRTEFEMMPIPKEENKIIKAIPWLLVGTFSTLGGYFLITMYDEQSQTTNSDTKVKTNTSGVNRKSDDPKEKQETESGTAVKLVKNNDEADFDEMQARVQLKQFIDNAKEALNNYDYVLANRNFEASREIARDLRDYKVLNFLRGELGKSYMMRGEILMKEAIVTRDDCNLAKELFLKAYSMGYVGERNGQNLIGAEKCINRQLLESNTKTSGN